MDDMRLEEISRAYRSQLGEAPPAVTDAAVTAFRARSASVHGPARGSCWCWPGRSACCWSYR